jgi:hypothetical protein
MTNEAWLAGQLMTDIPLADVADAFRRAGLDAYYHRNPHGDEELAVDGAGDADCLLQREAPSEYRVADAGGERGALEDMARAMSTVLTGMRIVHQLELCNVDDRERFAYLDYGWPVSESG